MITAVLRTRTTHEDRPRGCFIRYEATASALRPQSALSNGTVHVSAEQLDNHDMLQFERSESVSVQRVKGCGGCAATYSQSITQRKQPWQGGPGEAKKLCQQASKRSTVKLAT